MYASTGLLPPTFPLSPRSFLSQSQVFLICTDSALLILKNKNTIYTSFVCAEYGEPEQQLRNSILFPGQYGTCKTCGAAAERLCFLFWDQFDIFQQFFLAVIQKTLIIPPPQIPIWYLSI